MGRLGSMQRPAKSVRLLEGFTSRWRSHSDVPRLARPTACLPAAANHSRPAPSMADVRPRGLRGQQTHHLYHGSYCPIRLDEVAGAAVERPASTCNSCRRGSVAAFRGSPVELTRARARQARRFFSRYSRLPAKAAPPCRNVSSAAFENYSELRRNCYWHARCALFPGEERAPYKGDRVGGHAAAGDQAD